MGKCDVRGLMSSVSGPLAPCSPIALSCSHSQNYCVLAKLRDFVASPQCWKMAEVDTLKDRVRKLYTIMNSFCRRVSEALEDWEGWKESRGRGFQSKQPFYNNSHPC